MRSQPSVDQKPKHQNMEDHSQAQSHALSVINHEKPRFAKMGDVREVFSTKKDNDDQPKILTYSRTKMMKNDSALDMSRAERITDFDKGFK